MDPKTWDFSGWATVVDRKCTDGRTIRKDAFKDNDGKIVPLVWNHQHNEPANVLGHAMLKAYPEGMYAFGKFNETESGLNAKALVDNGDINALSIYAAQLTQNGGDVFHGDIKEVSLVLAGANPGAFIDQILSHADGDSQDAAIIYTGEEIIHGEIYDEDDLDDEDEDLDDEDLDEEEDDEEEEDEELEHADSDDDDDDDDGQTVGDVIKTLNKEQKVAVTSLLKQLIDKYQGSDNSDKEDEGEEKDMKHNVFDSEEKNNNVLSHADQADIIQDAKRYGSLKDSVMAHAATYGIEDIDILFPDDKAVPNEPVFLKRRDDWVAKVMNGAHHTPFSRIKSMYADITGDDARARGYIKGNQKVEEVFPLFKRSTPPTTVYKKQKLDRNDILDITDFDVVAWLKREMRGMLDEEIARAVLLGDGRSPASDDKIDELCIRPIYSDTEEEVYAFYVPVEVAADDTDDSTSKKIIRAIIKARKDYRGTGTPTFFCTEDVLTNMLLLEDLNGRIIYDSVDKLATALRVKEIVTVPVMDNMVRTDDDSVDHTLAGIVVNMADYNIGADRGGQVSMFDDFDIDYNQQKYLIETRCSGALTVPKSAMIVELHEASE